MVEVASRGSAGCGGNLKDAGEIRLPDLRITSSLEIGEIVAVAMDGKALAQSGSILLQVMSEEKASGFATEPSDQNSKRITQIGADPWLIRELKGTVSFLRPDAEEMAVLKLDINGMPQGQLGTADAIELEPGTAYYWIKR